MSWPGSGSGTGPFKPPVLHPRAGHPPPLAARTLAELSPTRAFLLPEKLPPGTGCVFWRPGQARSRTKVPEPGEVTVPGGMAGARPEPPEEGTKPGPARVACPCSWKRELKTRGATASVEKKSLILLPPCLAVQSQQLRGSGDISTVPTLPWRCPGWDGTDGHRSGAGRAAGPGHVPLPLVAMWKSVVYGRGASPGRLLSKNLVSSGGKKKNALILPREGF